MASCMRARAPQACQPCVWRGLASLRLLPAVLCLLTAAAACLASDCIARPGEPPHDFDADRIARWGWGGLWAMARAACAMARGHGSLEVELGCRR